MAQLQRPKQQATFTSDHMTTPLGVNKAKARCHSFGGWRRMPLCAPANPWDEIGTCVADCPTPSNLGP
eukprot:896705-Alexandrium_andersonii.AAC.1